MRASLKRRLERASLKIESAWRDSWDEWFTELLREWRRIDPQINEHFAECRRYEQEWACASTDGERAEFLSRGMSLCVSRGLPGELWVWYWKDVHRPVVEGDLQAWPRLLESPTGTTGRDLIKELAALLSSCWVYTKSSDDLTPN